MAKFRTDEMEQKYLKYRKDGHMSKVCNLCEKAASVIEFNHWKIVENIFPWDRIAKIHHMIIPKRHIAYEQLNEEEKNEFDEIKLGHIEPRYEFIMEATTRIKSIPQHFHLHLITMKEETKK
ncbi:MAG: hypothetical protein WAV15_00485 [Minisyncoccia bacterium]